MQTSITERSKSKKGEPLPSWLPPLVFPDLDVPDSFTPPTCVMSTPLDPLASLQSYAGSTNPRPGHIICAGYYELDPNQPLATVFKHKNFVEFPTVEVWEEGAFHGTIVDDQGTVMREEEERSPKRRKLNVRAGRKAINGLLGGYGSEEEAEKAEERNVMSLLGGYAESDEEEQNIEPESKQENYVHGGNADEPDEDGLSDQDAEGETDDEWEENPEDLVVLLERLRQVGALRDPAVNETLASFGDGDDERVDWGDSGDED